MPRNQIFAIGRLKLYRYCFPGAVVYTLWIGAKVFTFRLPESQSPARW